MILQFICFNAHKILCQSVVYHLALKTGHQLKPLGRVISKRGEVVGVQLYLELYLFFLEIIGVSSKCLLDSFKKKFPAFSIRYDQANYQATLKYSCYGGKETLSRPSLVC